jgi:hypothetical protein
VTITKLMILPYDTSIDHLLFFLNMHEVNIVDFSAIFSCYFGVFFAYFLMVLRFFRLVSFSYVICIFTLMQERCEINLFSLVCFPKFCNFFASFHFKRKVRGDPNCRQGISTWQANHYLTECH